MWLDVNTLLPARKINLSFSSLHVEEGVIRFRIGRIWPQKAPGLWIFAVNRADRRILKTQWIMNQL